MFKYFPKLLLIAFFLALILRIVSLESFPVGFHADEVKAGWNAYSILETGKDDKLQNFSLYYNSFGDFRPTGICYFIIPSILIFGVTEFAVRFPSALFGALTVFPLYFFVLETTKKKNLALISTFFLAILPWHIEVSRATNEAVISMFFALTSLYFLLKLIKSGKLHYLLLTCATILVSFLLYHSIRVLAPLFFITIIFFYIKQIKSKKFVLFSLIFVIGLTAFFSLTPEARSRLNQVSIFNDQDTIYEIDRLRVENLTSNTIKRVIDNKYFVYSKRFIAGYSSYFSSNFLISDSAKPYRYTTPGSGLLTYVEFALLLTGIFAIIKKEKNYLVLFLLLLAPLPAAFTTEDTPNLDRAIFMIPFLVIIEAYGAQLVLSKAPSILKMERNPSEAQRTKGDKKLIGLVLFLFFLANTSYFLYMYFNHANSHKPFTKDFVLDGSSYRNYGSKDLGLELELIKGDYDKIIVTNSPDNLYPWYAFFNKKDPKEFNQNKKELKDGSFQYENIIFSQTRCPSDDAFDKYPDKKLLVIDTGITDCLYQSKIDSGLKAKVKEKILLPNGSDGYVFLERDLKD